MKTKALLLLFVLFTANLFAQNSFTFYSERGEKFFVIIDGVPQNKAAARNVLVEDLDDKTHSLVIEFEADSMQRYNIYEKISTSEKNGVISKRKYKVGKEGDSYKLIIEEGTEYVTGTTKSDKVISVLNAINEATRPPCEVQGTGLITFTNNSNNPYNIYVDNVYVARITGGYKQSFNVSAGQHTLKCEQVSGYLMYPTVKSVTMNVPRCSNNQSWTFPF